MITPKELAARLRLIRTVAGLTQADLAERSGVKSVVISELERGSRRLSVHHLFALAEACGWDASVVISGRFNEAYTERRKQILRGLYEQKYGALTNGGHLKRVVVDEIRRRLAFGASQSDLAREHNVTRQAISLIAKGRVHV